MSIQDDLKGTGIKLTKEQKLKIKVLIFNWKNQRKAIEAQVKSIAKGKKGKLDKAERRQVAKLMERRAMLSRKIFRFGGERKEPDFDPY